MDTKKGTQRKGRDLEEKGSMAHLERRKFPKDNVSSSEAEQENDPKCHEIWQQGCSW